VTAHDRALRVAAEWLYGASDTFALDLVKNKVERGDAIAKLVGQVEWEIDMALRERSRRKKKAKKSRYEIRTILQRGGVAHHSIVKK
jgi:hypothetical protein